MNIKKKLVYRFKKISRNDLFCRDKSK